MKPDRPNTTVVIIDIRYSKSMNEFEEFYGECVTYQELEQESYVEFKEMMFNGINRNIKFRKYGRIGPVLTVKADMLEEEIDNFKSMLKKEQLKFLHNWAVTDVTIIRENDRKEPEENNIK